MSYIECICGTAYDPRYNELCPGCLGLHGKTLSLQPVGERTRRVTPVPDVRPPADTALITYPRSDPVGRPSAKPPYNRGATAKRYRR